MATPAQVAVIQLCDLCELGDSRWFCCDCQIKLCDQCKITHQRGPKTKNDNIIPIGEVQQGAEGTVVPVLCDTHKTKVCELYCFSCEKFICAQCSISMEHKSHSFNIVETLIDTDVSELEKIEEKFKGKISSYNTVLDSEGKEHADYMMHIDHLEDEVKGHTDKIVKEFHKLRDKQLLELSTLRKEEERRYQAKCNQYQSRLTDIRQNIESVQKAKVSGNAFTMKQVIKESTQIYQSLEDPTASNLHRPEFEREENPEAHLFLQLQGRLTAKNAQEFDYVPAPQTDDRVSFAKRVIDINKVKVKLKIKIKGKTGFVRDLIPTENNMAWIAIQPDKHLSLINSKGKVVKKSVELDDEIYHAVLYYEDILVRNGNSHCVMKFNKDGDSVTIFADLSPFYTRGLCVTRQNDVLVCLVSSVTFDCSSKVVRLNSKGQQIQEIQYRNGKPLFTAACTVTSLPTGDMVVVDFSAKDVRKVICVDESGSYKYTWNGEVGGRKMSKFWLSRVTHDGQKVFITDRTNDCVYVLDKNGNAEEFTLDKLGVKKPAAISIDNDGKFWIGCESNIYVLE